MALSEVDFPYSYYPDPTKGRPVFNGYLYFGQPNTDPEIEANQVDVYALTDGTVGDPVQIAQPVSTNAGGIPTYNGSAVSLFIEGDYSVKVLDKNRQQVYFAQNKAAALTKDDLGDFTNYIFRTVSDAKAGIVIGGDTVTLEDGDFVRILERKNALFNVVLTSSVTPNEFDIIVSTSQPDLSFELSVTDIVTAIQIGAKGDGATDDTAAIDTLLSKYTQVYLEAGTYNVDDMSIRENTHVRTDGKDTVIQQNSRPEVSDNRCIYFVGSNVHLETVTVIGNIATDPSEQNHAMFINAVGSGIVIENINIDDCFFQDIRGEAIYMQGRSGGTVKGVNIGFVRGDNIYRQGVNSNGNVNGFIKGIDLTRVGLNVFNTEPEVNSNKVEGLKVGYVRGKSVSILATEEDVIVDGVEIDYLDIDGNRAVSDPPFGGSAPDTAVFGLTTRNCNYVRIGVAKINNFTSYGINVVFNVGEAGTRHLRIDDLQISNCSIEDTTNNAYILSDNLDYLSIGRIRATVTDVGTAKQLFRLGETVHVESGVVDLPFANSVYMQSVMRSVSRDMEITGNGILFSGGSRHTISHSNFEGNRVGSGSDRIVFEHCDMTANAFLWTSGSDNNYALNTTFTDENSNVEYYAAGFTSENANNYLNTFRFGDVRMWADASGIVRINNGSDPANNTDGTVVGTQT